MPELESKKTGGLTALGVLAVVFGGLWFIAGVWALLQPGAMHLMVERYHAPELLTGFSVVAAYVDAAVNLLLAMMLFAAGVGLLQLKTWGGWLAARWAAARILWSVIAALLAFVGPFAARPDPENLAPGFKEFMQERFTAIATTEIIAGFILSSVLAVIFLCLLSRQSFKNNLS